MKCKMLGGTFPENATLTKDGDINTGFMVNTSIIGKIETITQITEENKGNFLGKTARGVGGYVLFGGIGALAGVLSGTNKKEVTVNVELKDGMGEFLAIVDVEALQNLYVWQKQKSVLSTAEKFAQANAEVVAKRDAFNALPIKEQEKIKSKNRFLCGLAVIIFLFTIYLLTKFF